MKTMSNTKYILLYIIHKVFKKIRFCAIRNSSLHQTAKLEAGTSFIESTIGRYSFCGYDCDVYMADIGSFCSIANDVVIGGNAHPVDWVSTSPVFYNNVDSVKKKFSRFDRVSPIRTTIGHDVWIGRGALIKQGINIGSGAVVGMGAVVTKDVEPYAIVAGNPAKTLRMRFDKKTIIRLLDSQWWELSDEVLERVAVEVKNPDGFIKKIASQKDA